MRYISIAMVAGMLFTAAQCTPKTPENPVSAVENKEKIPQKTLKQAAAEGALLVDVRTPEEFASGSFPGAVNIPLEEVSSRTAEFINDKGVIIFCRTGNRSGQAIEILKQSGITNTYNGINQQTLEREIR